MKKLIWCLVLAAPAFGAHYPVNDDINELKWKVSYLETLRDTFEAQKCVIELDGNSVRLVPGALRSEGLVMAIGKNFPGNYLAYHKAPKPQFLHNVVAFTLGAPAADGAVIIGSRIGYDAANTPQELIIFVAKPFKVQGADNLWLYNKTYLKVPFPQKGVASESKATLADGRAARLTCNE